MERFILISFNSTHQAIKSESVTGKANLKTRLIPTPPEVSAGCGLSLRLEETDKTEVEAILRTNEIQPDSWYIMTRENGKRKVEKING